MWYLIDMVHINIWILYHFHFRKNGKPHKNQKSLPLFSSELSDALIIASKVNLCSSREGSPKQRSLDAPTTDKKPTEALAVMFILIKLHIGEALLSTKIDADYSVWPAEFNVPNARSFSFYWLIATFVDFHTKP